MHYNLNYHDQKIRHSMVSVSISSGGDHSIHILLMRPNKVEIAVQWYRVSRVVLVGFSGHSNTIYDSIIYVK